MARRTKPEAQATREHLLDTAEQVILQRGLARSSLQHIAEAAGLSRGAIYWHFADKLTLFNAIMDRVDLPLEQAVASTRQWLDSAEGQAPDLDALPVLRALALQPFDLMQRDLRARRAFTILMHRTEFVGDLAPLALRQAAAINGFLGLMERLFRAHARRRPLAPGVDAPMAAWALIGLIDGLLRLSTLAPHADAAPALQAAVAPAIDALLRGLGQAG